MGEGICCGSSLAVTCGAELSYLPDFSVSKPAKQARVAFLTWTKSHEHYERRSRRMIAQNTNVQ